MAGAPERKLVNVEDENSATHTNVEMTITDLLTNDKNTETCNL